MWDGNVLKSTDSGSYWEQVFAAGSAIWSIVLSDNYANDATVFASSISNGIFISENAALNWRHLDASNTTVIKVAISPDFASDGTIFAGTDVGSGGLYKSTDGAVTWHLSNTGIVGNQLIKSCAISPNYTVDSTVFAGDHDGNIYRSVDKGITWQNVYYVLAGSDISGIAVSPGYPIDRTVFATSNDGIYKSTDQGTTWLPSGLGGKALLSLAVSPNYVQDGTIFAGTRTGLYKSTDGGINWMTGGFAGSLVNSLALSSNYASDQTIFATLLGPTPPLYRSNDGGSTWSQIGTGRLVVTSPNYPTDGTVFSADWNNGVFMSPDDGLTWTLIGNIPHVMSLALPPNFSSDQRIFVGTGDGVYSYAFSFADTTPNPFTFNNQTGVAVSTPVISNTITVSGITAPAPISITGGQYSINGGVFTSAFETVNNGDTVTVRVTSSGSYGTKTSAALTIGGVSGTFAVTTSFASAPSGL